MSYDHPSYYYGVEREEQPGTAPADKPEVVGKPRQQRRVTDSRPQTKEGGSSWHGVAVILIGLCIMASPLYYVWVSQFGIVALIAGAIGFIILLAGILGTASDLSKRKA